MKKQAKKSLALARETLRNHDAVELSPIQGGAVAQTGVLNNCSGAANCSLIFCSLVGWWH